MAPYIKRDWAYGDLFDEAAADHIETGIEQATITAESALSAVEAASGAARAGSALIVPGFGNTNNWVSIMPMLSTALLCPNKNPNEVIAAPIHIPANLTVDRISLSITTPGLAGGTVRAGIFNLNANGKPTTVLCQTGDIPSDTSGIKEVIIPSTVIPAGLYGILATASDATVRVRAWVYPDWYLASGTSAAAPSFSSSFGTYSGPAWADDMSTASWGRNDYGGKGIPILYLHTTAVS